MPRSTADRPTSFSLVTSWLALLWLIFAVDIILRSQDIWLANWAGLQPRTLSGLWGILGCHVLHAHLPHLASNSVGLLALGLVGCWYSRVLTGYAVLYAAFCSAAFTWVVASPDSIHIGASGILFGLVGFLVFNGIFRRSWGAFFLALLVGVLASGAIPGMLPTAENKAQLISWQMHLGGFLGGVLASWQLRRERPV